MQTKPKIYISGPVTGVENYRERFHAMEEILITEGYEAINPVKDVPDDADTQNPVVWLSYLKEEMDLVASCDAIVLLDGWERSKGCLVEYCVATRFGRAAFRESSLGVGALLNEINDWCKTVCEKAPQSEEIAETERLKG